MNRHTVYVTRTKVKFMKTKTKHRRLLIQGSLFAAVIISLSACSGGGNKAESLREKYSAYFPVGVAIGKQHLEGYDTVLIKKNFASITAENDMKPENTINEEGEFTFEAGDRIVEFAANNGLLVRGHTLVWYNQTDDWFYRDSTGEFLSKEAMLDRLEGYITTVLDHYRGKVYAWDVVNEAIAYEGEQMYREDIDWFRICGPEYIEKAFVFARNADPEVKLFYNDYNLIDPVKAKKVYDMVKDFQQRGIPVDGIGMQGHWTLEDVNAEKLSHSIDLFASLGLEVQITELDISIYPFYHNVAEEYLPKEKREFTEEIEEKQADKYAEVFSVFRDKANVVTNVTLWGVADNNTWLSNYFVKGRTDYPLLFDNDYEPKRAFETIMDF